MTRDHDPSDSPLIFQPVWLNAINEITRPDRTISIAEYDWNRWLPLLGPERWALVHKLRAMHVFRPGDTTTFGRRATIQIDSIPTLAKQLGLPDSRVYTILTNELIPGENRWRRLTIPEPGKRNPQEALHALHLRHFIPRLRFRYIPQKGRPPRRSGLIIELVLDLLPVPEDMEKLGLSPKSLISDLGNLNPLQAIQASSPKSVISDLGRLNPLQAKLTTTTTTERDSFEPIWQYFAAQQNEHEYRPSDKDRKKLAQLFSEGISEPVILAGIDKAFADYRASRKRGRIQRFAYCVPIIRSLAAQTTTSPPPQETSTREESRADQPSSPSPSEYPETVPPRGADAETSDEPVAADDELAARYALAKATLGDLPTDEAVDDWERTRLRQLAAEYQDVAQEGSPPATGRDWVRAAIDEARASPSTYDLTIKLLEIILARWAKEGFRADRQFPRRPRRTDPGQDRRQGHPRQPEGYLRHPEGHLRQSVLPAMSDSDDNGRPPPTPPTPAEQLWKKAAGQLELQMPRATYNSWVQPLKPIALEGDVLTLETGSRQAYEWLTSRLREKVVDAASQVSDNNGPINVQFVLPGGEKENE